MQLCHPALLLMDGACISATDKARMLMNFIFIFAQTVTHSGSSRELDGWMSCHLKGTD